MYAVIALPAKFTEVDRRMYVDKNDLQLVISAMAS